MSTQIQRRRGTTAQHSSFTGALGETTIDTDKEVVVVHDGVQVGGYPQMRENGSNSALALGSAGTPSLKFTGDPNTGIYSPGADQVAISTNGTGKVIVGSTGTVNFVGAGTAGSTQAVSFNGSAPVNSLVIDSSGRVGIGTSSPSGFIHIQGSGTGTETYGRFTTGSASGDQSLVIKSGSSRDHMAIQVATNAGVADDLALQPDGGRVGVGTSSPAAKLNSVLSQADNASSSDTTLANSFLHLGGGEYGINRYFLTTYGYSTGRTNSGAFVGAIGTDASGYGKYDLIFGTRDVTTDTAPTTRMIIKTDGKVGVGTTSPGFKFDVKMSGSARTDGLAIRRSDNDNHQLGLWTSGGVMYFDAVTDNTGTPGQITFRRSDNTGSSFSESMRIDSSGRLLVGTSLTSSSALLQVQGNSSNSTGDAIIQLRRGENNVSILNGESLGSIQFSNSESTVSAVIEAVADANWNTTNDYPSRLVFSTTADGASSPTERMRITQDGNLRHIAVNSEPFYLSTGLAAGTSNALMAGYYSGTSTTSLGTNCFLILTNGNVRNTNNSYGAISDIKLKENIVDANSQWDDLKALQVRNYNFKEGQTHTQIGLVAQEAELVSPGLVTESPDRDEDGNDLGTVTKSVNYSVLYMKAVKALQEAMERIEALEAKVAALEGA